jgi:hypothetical protein
VDVFDQSHAAGFELSGNRGHAVGLEVEVEMTSFVNVSDRRVFHVDKFQVDELAAGSNPGVEVAVGELD